MGAAETSTPVVAGCGLTWSLVQKQQQAFSVTQYLYLWIGTGTPSTGTVTVTVDASDTASEIEAVLFEVEDADSTLPQAAVSTANYASGAQSVSFGSTTDSANTVLAILGQHETQTAIGEATGFTELAFSAAGGREDVCAVHYIEASAETAAGGTFTNNYMIIGVELADAGGGGGSIAPQARYYFNTLS